jgi:hypothetical protein
LAATPWVADPFIVNDDVEAAVDKDVVVVVAVGIEHELVVGNSKDGETATGRTQRQARDHSDR